MSRVSNYDRICHIYHAEFISASLIGEILNQVQNDVILQVWIFNLNQILCRQEINRRQ